MIAQTITKLLIALKFRYRLSSKHRILPLFSILSCLSLVTVQIPQTRLGLNNTAKPLFDGGQLAAQSPAVINKCPIQLDQLLALRGFRLGASITEFTKSFQGNPPSIPEPDPSGIRSLKFNWSEEPRKLTDMTQIEFRFFDDRLYQIEATYKMGTEWEERPLSEFAEAISRGMGVEARWAEMPDKKFRLDCGQVRFNLWVMEPTMSRSSLPAGQMAIAFLTLTATESEAQIKKREESFRQQQQRNSERRRVFTP
ncbi:MAG TPA: hypothetical protein VJS44_02825 [Pyrinomonadaceae bacterium]|nr:hypothetical protein [Pyrinomonadaceae bacterium]